MRRLEDRAVLVTGGAQGIGKGVAARVLEEGGRVAIADLDAEAGEETVEELSKVGEVRFVVCDTAEEGMVADAVRTAVDAFGRLDGLVNNAGIACPNHGAVDRLELSDWNRLIAVNLTGYFLCVKHATPHLRERGRGSIVNISSTRALQAEPENEAYSASKGGVIGLTIALANSLGPAIRANAICPGWIDVRPWRKTAERRETAFDEKHHAQHPAGRIGRPEDIAALAAFLLSDESGFITGQTMVSDGGMTRKMIYL